MSEHSDHLCPFSKPIFGRWCHCPYARLSERCSGKMTCLRAHEYRQSCLSLVEVLKEKSRFVLGLNKSDIELTHAQLMKIRCGGLLGMQRVLKQPITTPPVVLGIIAAVETQYGAIAEFPFHEIVKDIQGFSHRKK